jgi:hypothetical protein
VNALADFVIEQTGEPLDVWAVAATLESRGVRDLDARERYGKRDVFELAEEVLAECRRREPVAAVPLGDQRSRGRRALRDAGFFLRGGFFFFPLLIQLVTLLWLGYGLWASLDFSSRQASIVGMALLASFFVTGALSQVLGYLGPYAAGPGRYRVAERVSWLVVGFGAVAAAGLGLLVWLANLAFDWYDERTIGAGLAYYGLSSALSLTSAILYMLKRYDAMLASIVVGLVVVGLVHGSVGTYAANWLGLGAAIVVEGGWGLVALRRRARRTAPELRVAAMPRAGVLVSLALPFVLYGSGYFLLLFADRLAVWSDGSQGRPFTFRPAYEVGLDWALISVAIGIAYLEVVINAFSERLALLGERFGVADTGAHNRELRRFYVRRLAVVALLVAGGSALAFAGLVAARHDGPVAVRGFFAEPNTVRVYAIATLGYALLVWGLYNGAFLFSLGRPWLVVRALGPGVVVALVLAFTLSRTVAPWAAVGGLAAGTFVFAVLSARATLRLLRDVDYHYFAAY